MPFRYDTPQNPYVGSIADMIARRGDVAANREIQVANAAAAGEVGAANAWAGGVRDITQQVGGQMMRIGERMADPAAQADKIRLAQLQRDDASQKVIEAAVTNPANLKADGSGVDDAKVAAFLQKSGNGHAAIAWQGISAKNAENRLTFEKTLGEINGQQIDQATKLQKLSEARRSYLSELAFHTEQAIGPAGHSDPLHARDTFMAGVATAAVDGGLSKEQARSVLARTAGASPKQLQDILASLVDPNDRAKLEGSAAETRLKGAQADEAVARAAAIAKYGTTGTPPAAQSEKYRVKGVGDVPLEFLPGRTAADPGHYFLNSAQGRREVFPGQDFTAIPPASVTVNAQAAAAADNLPAWARDASKPTRGDAAGNVQDPQIHMTPNGLYQDAQTWIATGQYPPMGRGADPISVARRSAIDAKVGAIAGDAGVDVPTLRALYKANAGSLAKTQQYSDAAESFMSTADKNMGLLEKALARTPDLGAPVLNKPWRSFQQEVLGSTAMSEFRTYLQSIRNEYGKIITSPNLSAQFTDSAREEAGSLLADDATVGQVLASAKALKAEGGNRLASLGEQLHRIQARMQTHDETPPPATPPPAGQAPAAPAGWKYVPKQGGGWTAVRAQ